MLEFLQGFLGENLFIPHGHCYLWKPGLVWLHIASDSLIAVAYYSIPLALVYFVQKREDLPFNWIFLLFGAFIVLCGSTHIMEVWTLWHPTYWLSGFLKALTALVSVYTAMVLVSIIPQALALPSPAQLEEANCKLEAEILERQCIEEKLRASETRLWLVMDNIPQYIFWKDRNCVYLGSNRSFARVVGLNNAKEIVGKTDYDLPWKPEEVEFCRECDTRVMATDTPEYHILESLSQANGKQIWVDTNKIPLHDAEGKVVGIIGTVEDISDRKAAEEQLQQLLAELARSNQELEQFAYVASHDLREPLRKIKSYTDLLAKRYSGQLDEKADKYIAYVSDGAVRMEALIMDLLTYSRVGKGELVKEPIDIAIVLKQTLSDLSRTIDENHAVINADSLPTVNANSRQMGQLLQNLIANAIKFRREQPPRISIKAKLRDRFWIFSVQDNGIGIEPQNSDRIFAIFQRLHSREEYPGTGIGLAVCKKIVERHSGQIWVESELGRGTTFFFTLPAGDW